jgi:ornithine cyclodeaminase/alanine dehydrogenase-like protein (mu-crystallin family)
VKVLVVDQAAVGRLLPMGECMDAMEGVLGELARGETILPLRMVMRLPDGRGAFGAMPGYLAASRAIGIKAISVFPGNHGSELDSHQGAVLLFEGERGRLLAVMDASSITAIRTAAVSGVATRRLARADAGDLAILGTGVQARTHLAAMRIARPLRRVRVWSRDSAHAAAFAARESERHGIAVESASSARAAVDGADIVCTVTASREPVLLGEWLAPGTHVNAVGACFPDARELDTAAVVRSRAFVDRRESALAEAGDILIPRREGAIGDEHVLAELGEVVTGKHAGRRDDGEVTLFKSLGIAIEDVASARVIYANAERAGDGVWVELGGARE